MNQLKTVLLLGVLTGLLVAIGQVIGGTNGAIIGLILAAVMNLGSWFFSDKIALAAYGAQPVTPDQAPELYGIVQRLCQRARLPIPAIYIVPTNAANAFATGRDPEHAAVAVTEGIMQILPADELEAVIAHELSHVYNRDTLTQAVAATIAGAISFLAQMAYFLPLGSNDDDGPNPLVAILSLVLAPVGATIIQMGISRTREFSADAGAAKLTGNPRALARALQRLEASARQMPLEGNPAFSPLLIMHPLSGEGLANLFATHPSTEKRIAHLLQLERQMING